MSLLGILLFFLALTLAIFFHEGGHYLTAKWFGMRVERFFLGFGPTIWSFRRGETEYGIKAIPAGGFCKISGMGPHEMDDNFGLEGERRSAGQTGAARPGSSEQRTGTASLAEDDVVVSGRTDPDARVDVDAADREPEPATVTTAARTGRPFPEDDDDLPEYLRPAPPERQFRNKPAWQRAIVLSAGSITHFIAAFVILYFILVGIGLPTGNATNEVRDVVAQVPETDVPTAAAAAGLRSGDRIVTINGEPVANFGDLRTALDGTAGQEIELVYERDGEQVTTALTPTPVERDGVTTAFIGVAPTPEITRFGPGEGVLETFRFFWEFVKGSFEGIRDLPQGLATRVENATDRGQDGGTSIEEENVPVGIVGISRLAGQATAADQWTAFLLLLVSFNIFIGIVNLFPIPPMDGGYLAFLAIEKITGRQVNLNRIAPIAAFIVLLLLILTVGLLVLDFVAPIADPFR